MSAFEEIRLGYSAHVPFVDREFPSEESKKFFSKRNPDIQWLRPKDLCNPRKIERKVYYNSRIETEEPCDHTRGRSLFPQLFNRLLMPGQSFNDDYYNGMFMFKFWRYGTAVEVIIDDTLPCYKGTILSVRKKRSYEYINPLVEKAYAKLYGGYEIIEKYTFEHIMADYHGRIVEPVPVGTAATAPTDLNRIIITGLARNSWVIATTKRSRYLNGSLIFPNGLVSHFPYVINRIHTLLIDEYLVRLKPRWPMKMVYTGPWSQSSTEWNAWTEAERNTVGLILENQHEFWMPLSEIGRSFGQLELYHLVPQLAIGLAVTWVETVLHSGWRNGEMAGGTISSVDTFGQNPQFLLTIMNADYDHNGLATIILEFTQKNRLVNRQRYLRIGYYVFQYEERPDLQMLKIFHNESFDSVRSIVDRLNLPVGRYLIVPVTKTPNQTGEFIFRMLSETQHILSDMRA